MVMNSTTRTRLLLVGKLLLVLVFAISFKQEPLYSSNQNTYFVHGLANAGERYLSLDWLAQTTDPFPVFSALVTVTTCVLGENALYLFQVVIQGIYAYSILGIGSHVLGLDNTRKRYLCCSVVLAALFSGLLARFLSELDGLRRFASIVGPNGLLTGGVAGQYILGPVLQPSVFGIFIVTSIYAFLREKPFVAIACLAVAATFHPTYLLSAAVLTCTYLAVIGGKDKDYRKALLLGTTAFVLVIPVLAYNYVSFGPTTPDAFAQAQSILVQYRIPHHTLVSHWFGRSTLFKITLVALSIYLSRRTRLFPVLLGSLVVAMTLTVAQVLTGNDSLALLFPWRISVFLVPIASSIVLASITSMMFRILNKPLARVAGLIWAAIVVAIVVLGYSGVRQTIALLNAPRVGVTASTRFAASTFQPGDLYLIPPNMESFRLAARVPIFIDHKSHPYGDTEIIEWFRRLEIARDFYASNGDAACNILQNVSEEYGITRVIVESESLVHCDTLHESYRDADLVIYQVQSRQ